ncbi:TolC family protein [Flammeovirga kamogawensis]|uniref:Efflux transporter outer membrane subunit n=1 Tax=Flammeovirga kamogawensis TaxID=373891 RepID=A0ABX8H119_9BACT|nr:TolC family protein [Flammeovirga kamogawensis]MBB6463271.1 NodT family efflux transporter outer membrane factor (OMF) lipoprotein [Flammeovirga kamogawensis]QWG09579.1 efflux transporter outer membrane subunit [Flammeovirga kamogawensis]
MKSIKYLVYSILIGLLFTSCLLRKEYKRTVQVDNDHLYRIDTAVDSTQNFGTIIWADFFKDSVLKQYIERGLEQNFDVRIALENVEIAKSRFKQGKQVNLPTISGNVSGSYIKNTQNGQFGNALGDISSYNVGLDVSWEADIWGKLKATTEVARMNLLQQSEVKKAITSDLVSQIAFSYYRLIGYDKQKEILEKTITSRQESLEVTEALFSAGEVTLVAVKQSEALLYNSKVLLVEVEKNIEITENALSFLMGESGQLLDRDTTFTDRFDFKLDVGLPIQLLENRPDVKSAEYLLINSFEQVNIAKANFYPTLKISAGGGFQSTALENWFSPSSFLFNVLGQATQPIWNQRKIKTEYEVSQSQEKKALFNFQKQILMAGQEVSNSVMIINRQGDIINNQQLECDAYRDAVEYSQDLLLFGSANYLEVITARQNLLQAELILVNRQLDLITEYIKLYNALGGGWS